MAKRSGKRSQADLDAAKFIVRISPVRELNEWEQAGWTRIISAWPPDHFIASDAETLTMLVASGWQFEDARRQNDFNRMEKAGRLWTTLATKLRLTPQARYDTQAAARRANDGKSEPALDALLQGAGWQNQPNDTSLMT